MTQGDAVVPCVGALAYDGEGRRCYLSGAAASPGGGRGGCTTADVDGALGEIPLVVPARGEVVLPLDSDRCHTAPGP